MSDKKPIDQYAVVGNPIAHSKSPQIHNIFAGQSSQQMEYTAMLSSEESFDQDLKDFFSSNGKGLNVTVPFKLRAFDFADQLSERAQQAGAVNTLILSEEGVRGDNTDGIGLVNDLKNNQSLVLKAKRILIIGAGGASRGVIAPLFLEQPESITIVNRTVSKAQGLSDTFSDLGNITALGFESLVEQEPYDLIINASSAGLSGEAPAIPDSLSLSSTFCYDMVYSKDDTPFVAWAKQRGCQGACDGLGMLVEQAAESFYLWRGERPNTAPVLKELREGLS